MANSVSATIRYLLARCDGTLTPLRRRNVGMPADTSVQQLIEERVGKMLSLVLGTAQRACSVAGFVVTMPTDGDDAPTALYHEQWATEMVADGNQLEVIFVEESYDVVSKAVGTGDAVDDAAQALDEEVRKRLLENGVSREDLKRIFQADHESSKMKRLLELLVPVAKGGEKCVVVSQWESLLRIVGRHLDKARISHEIMSGKISAKERYAIAQRFNNSESKPQVLLLASQSCGTGVDLPGGTHMFLMEPQKSATLEEQVFNRLHRIGQTKDVHCYRLVAVDTVEQRVIRQRLDREYETNKCLSK